MMSISLAVWVVLFVGLCALTLARSSWGVALYLLTFYINPQFWWWGNAFAPGMSWNLGAALILAAGVFLDARRRPPDETGVTTLIGTLLVLYGINALLVHVLFAANPLRSYNGLVLVWKQIGLFLLLVLAIKDRFDFKVFVYSIIVGALYISYEVVINQAGHFSEGRLEGLRIANIGDANYLAGLLSLSLPLGGWLLLCGKKLEKLFALVALPLILDTILRCNSRGVFLGLLCGAGWLVIGARGKIRRYAIAGIALGGIGAYMMMGDPDIMNRFLTIFQSGEDRDESAQSRLDMWTQAIKMIGDYPLGSGAEAAFKSELGMEYAKDAGIWKEFAVHNGYLDIAAGWGIQGVILYLTIIFLAWRRLRVAIDRARVDGETHDAFMGVCVDAALVTQLVCCMFISSLDSESFYWWVALALLYSHIFRSDRVATDAMEGADDDVERIPDGDLEPEHALA